MALSPKDNTLGLAIDLEPYQKAVNEAAARVRGLWLGYIALLAYLFITVVAVTHRDLLLGNPVSLPVLQVKLPLVGFFAVAPMFFLINHFFLLLQLFGLGQRLREFNDEIGKTNIDESVRRMERRKLDTFVIVQMLASPRKDREQVTGLFQRIIAIITLVIAPIILLLIIQLQFLPYQDELISWMHRGVLAVDLCLLWMFWPSIKQGEWAPAPWRGKGLPTWRGRSHWMDYMVSWRRYYVSWWPTLAMTIVMVFACLIATFPGEIADVGTNTQDWTKPDDSNLSWVKGQLFGVILQPELDQVKELSREGVLREPGQIRKRWLPFSRAIDLADDKTLIDLDQYDKINRRQRENKDNLEPWQAGRTLSLRNRNLRGAMFNRADLRNVDLHEANLQGASLEAANLKGAGFRRASLRGASFVSANLRDASLYKASLQDASFYEASLQGAWLYKASLQGASLEGASLQGASLYKASLQGASLKRANLQGVWLRRASLQGALLEGANLQGASLEGANLQGASLEKANLQGALLEGADLRGASLEATDFRDASLVGTFLRRSHGTPGNLEGTWVLPSKQSEISKKEFDKLKQNALTGVTSETVKKRINERLARFDPSQEGARKNALENWESNVSEIEYQNRLAERLTTLACDSAAAPYVAQGLIRYRLEEIDPDHRLSLARKLLDAAEGKTNDCPGGKGLGALSNARLREWAAETRPEGNLQQ